MAKFFDNMSGKQKLILIFGGFGSLIGTAVLFPEAYSTVFASVMDGIGAITQFFRDLGGS